MPGCNTWALVETVFPVLSRESNIKALESKCRVPKEVINTPVKETLPMIRPQSIPAQPKSPSSPDVIIEEIFEDDVEGKFLHTWCFQYSIVEYYVVCFVLCCVFVVILGSCKFFNDVCISLHLPLN